MRMRMPVYIIVRMPVHVCVRLPSYAQCIRMPTHALKIVRVRAYACAGACLAVYAVFDIVRQRAYTNIPYIIILAGLRLVSRFCRLASAVHCDIVLEPRLDLMQLSNRTWPTQSEKI
jgi:hypothetical protein